MSRIAEHNSTNTIGKSKEAINQYVLAKTFSRCIVCHGSGSLLDMTCPLCEGDPSFPIDGHTLATDTDTAGENVCSDLRLTWLYKAGQLDHPGKGLILLVLSLTLPQSDDWLLKCVAFAQQYFCNDRMGVVIWDEPHYD
eukprot:CAMPEP_0169387602 /NCGR_PEP_ID=MMETSP1017-20121227/45502_1 /TAXON_ID=342587 /ORGANISM="Karlodinium micrum, Strain CCMP2283" /LENGTH=138 /DNA_ID=CAMNT_0009489145 /DNA_START=22 /DNA_END=435 /DNA_ORIENTATION=+